MFTIVTESLTQYNFVKDGQVWQSGGVADGGILIVYFNLCVMVKTLKYMYALKQKPVINCDATQIIVYLNVYSFYSLYCV